MFLGLCRGTGGQRSASAAATPKLLDRKPGKYKVSTYYPQSGKVHDLMNCETFLSVLENSRTFESNLLAVINSPVNVCGGTPRDRLFI